MLLKKKLKLALFLGLTFLCNCQKKTSSNNHLVDNVSKTQSMSKMKIDSIKKIDFINYNYKYLDADYQITANSKDFENTIVLNNFHKENIKNYSDSLSVALMLEFGDWKVMNIAKSRILFSWEKLSFYLHKEKTDLQKIANELEITKHPYLLYSYFRSPEKSDVKNREMERLRKLLSSKLGFSMNDLKMKSNNNILDLSYKNHPEIIRLKEEFEKKHRHQ